MTVVMVLFSTSSMCKRSRQATARMDTKSYFMELSREKGVDVYRKGKELEGKVLEGLQSRMGRRWRCQRMSRMSRCIM